MNKTERERERETEREREIEKESNSTLAQQLKARMPKFFRPMYNKDAFKIYGVNPAKGHYSGWRVLALWPKTESSSTTMASTYVTKPNKAEATKTARALRKEHPFGSFVVCPNYDNQSPLEETIGNHTRAL